jgi:predicted phage terminase large subunit-like protein
MPSPVIWKPNPGAQTAFLASGAFEALYGGAAGGGKSAALLAASLRHVSEPSYRALILRRTFPELEKSHIERSRELFPKVAPGARYNDTKRCWRFPSGALIYFGHLEHEHDVHAYQSDEFSYIAFDELTTFTEGQYRYMLSRARSAVGLPVRIRSGTNPGGVGHEWVLRRWAPWLDADYEGERTRGGEARWFRDTGDGEEWCEPGTGGALSRTFIPAKLQDNPHLVANDPGYADRLMTLDPVTRAQLLEGDWGARPAAGAYFKREWFTLIDIPPADAQRVRYWDRAATAAKRGRDPDWTVGLRLARTQGGVFIVENVVRMRGTPADVEATIRQTAELDGKEVEVGIEEDPGSAGKFEAASYLRLLAGWNVRAHRVTGDKVTRCKPASAQAQAGNIKLVKAGWNEKLLSELEEFPEGSHDDQVDGLSGAFSVLAGGVAEPYSRAVASSSRSSSTRRLTRREVLSGPGPGEKR